MVTDETLTIYGDLQYINRLGQVHRGYTFEAQGLEGDMLVFTFNGQKAYAATYCCKQIQESAQPETADKAAKKNVPANLTPTTKAPSHKTGLKPSLTSQEYPPTPFRPRPEAMPQNTAPPQETWQN